MLLLGSLVGGVEGLRLWLLRVGDPRWQCEVFELLSSQPGCVFCTVLYNKYTYTHTLRLTAWDVYSITGHSGTAQLGLSLGFCLGQICSSKHLVLGHMSRGSCGRQTREGWPEPPVSESPTWLVHPCLFSCWSNRFTGLVHSHHKA